MKTIHTQIGMDMFASASGLVCAAAIIGRDRDRGADIVDIGRGEAGLDADHERVAGGFERIATAPVLTQVNGLRADRRSSRIAQDARRATGCAAMRSGRQRRQEPEGRGLACRSRSRRCRRC